MDADTTTADPGPTTADPGPTAADPGPTAADPGPTAADPGPTTVDIDRRGLDADPLATLDLDAAPVVLRRARPDDLPALVNLLAADQLGASRDGIETGDDAAAYLRAFEAIDADPSHLLVVGQAGSEVVATLQLSFIPGLARRGSLRGQIEAVRVRDDQRSQGLGAALMGWAIDECRRRGCSLVQLTTDKSRAEAHRFYARLGFVASHEGLKLTL